MKINEKIVIDTNILVYSLDKASQYFEFSRNIIDDNIENICITNKTISEFVCVMSKLKKYEVIENELPKVINNFTILFSDEISLDYYKELVLKHKPHGNVAYDFEIVSIMMANEIKTLVTINKKDFQQITGIEIISFP